MRRTIGLGLVLGVALGAQGADLGVAGRKLVLLDKLATAGRAKTVFVVRGDAGIAKGAAGDPGQLGVCAAETPQRKSGRIAHANELPGVCA